MKIDVLTLFPEMFSPLDFSIIKRARDKGIISINLYNIRDFSKDIHRRVDDYPYGGGSGMVMAADPIYNAVGYLKDNSDLKPRVILMSPEGRKYNQEAAKELSKEEYLILICGEIAAMAVIDSTCRLVPGVLSSKDSYEEESFYNGLLEYPQYTRPEEYNGMKVPEVLLSGYHEKIRLWRRCQSLKKTLLLRPDIIDFEKLSDEDKKILKSIESGNEKI